MPTSRQSRSIPYQSIIVLLFTAFVSLFLYTFVHESGHALVALSSGGRVQAFSINFLDFSAHVNVSGDFSPAQRIISNIAGVGLPILIWVAFIALAPRKANPALELFKLFVTLIALNPLLAWIFIPILSLFGAAPADDAANFLHNTGLAPLLVSLGAVLLYLAGLWLYLRRIESLHAVVNRLRTVETFHTNRDSIRTLIVLAGLAAIAGLATFGANGFSLRSSPAQTGPEPPSDAVLALSLDLSTMERRQVPVLTIEHERAGPLDLFVRLEQIETTLIDLRLAGPDGYDHPLLQGEGYRAELASIPFTASLPPGRYELILTHAASSGRLLVYTVPP